MIEGEVGKYREIMIIEIKNKLLRQVRNFVVSFLVTKAERTVAHVIQENEHLFCQKTQT